MANFRGYTVSPVQLGLSQTADILGQGLGAMGKNQLATEELGLRRSMAEKQLEQQQEERGLRMPGLKLQAEQAKIKQEQLEAPLTIGWLTKGDPLALQHWTNVSKTDPTGLTLTEKFSSLMGAQYDTNKESPTFGKFIREDGTPLKVRDLEPKWKEATELIMSNTDPDHLVSDQSVRYQQKVDYLKAKGVKDNDPQMREALNNLKKSNALVSDDSLKLRMYQKHRDLLGKFNNEDARREVAALDAKIAKIEEHGYQDKKTKEEQAFRASESAKDRAARKEEAEAGREAGRQPRPREIGSTRSYEAGGEKITKEWDGFQWKTLGTAPIVRGITDDKLPARTKAKLDGLKEERKAAAKALYEGDMLAPERRKELEGRIKEIDAEIDRVLGGKADPAEKGAGRQVVKTGVEKSTGKRVYQYDDGTTAYAEEAKPTGKESPEPEEPPDGYLKVELSGRQNTTGIRRSNGKIASFNETFDRLTPEQKNKASQAEKNGYQLSVKNGKIYVNVSGKDVLIGPAGK